MTVLKDTQTEDQRTQHTAKVGQNFMFSDPLDLSQSHLREMAASLTVGRILLDALVCHIIAMFLRVSL